MWCVANVKFHYYNSIFSYYKKEFVSSVLGITELQLFFTICASAIFSLPKDLRILIQFCGTLIKPNSLEQNKERGAADKAGE